MKPFTWEEIKSVLEGELKKTKSIMTFGTIGSCNVEHDIDVIIIKKPQSKSSDFYKEIHNLFDNLNNYLDREYNSKLIRLPGVSFVPEFQNLFKYSKDDLLIHAMVYGSYPQIDHDWNRAFFIGDTFKTVIFEEYDCFFGDKMKLFSKNFMQSNYADNLFFYLGLYDRLNSIHDEAFLVKVMNYYFDILYRKRLKLKFDLAKNKKDVKKVFYKFCDIIDNLNKKHNH
jgi:hypothetical protein